VAVPVLETGWTTADTAGGTANSLVIAEPASIATDDLIVIICGSDDAGAGAGFSSITEDSWTKFDDRDTGNGAKLAMFYRIADLTESATWTINVNNGPDEIWAFACRISGVDTTTPVHTGGATTGTVASSTTHQGSFGAVSVNPDNLHLQAIAFDGGDGVPFSLHANGQWPTNAKITDIQSGTAGTDACGAVFAGEAPFIYNGWGRQVAITSSSADGSNFFGVCIQSADPPTTITEVNGQAWSATSPPNPAEINDILSQNVFSLWGIPLQ